MSDSPQQHDDPPRLLFLNYFRLAQALVYVGSPSPCGYGLAPSGQCRPGALVAVFYLLFAVLVVSITHLTRTLGWLAVLGTLFIDIVAAVLAIAAMNDARIGIAMMLAVNPGRGAPCCCRCDWRCFLAALATLGVLGRTLAGRVPHLGSTDDRDFLESGLFGMAYFAIVVLCHVLGPPVARERSAGRATQYRLVNLSQVNELFIRRMKTGVDAGRRCQPHPPDQ